MFDLVARRCAGLIVSAVLLSAGHGALAQAAPDFGANVFVFNSKMPAAQMQAKIDAVYAKQEHSEFGTGRYAFLFAPGEYKLDVPVGFYTQVAGLGATPNAVHLTGNVHADAALDNNNATTTFWRAVEGFSLTPTGGTMQWATSQAVSFRRMHVLGDVVLHQKHGWASGGWMSDTKVDGTVDSGSQQQWISRNVEWGKWTGRVTGTWCLWELRRCRRENGRSRLIRRSIARRWSEKSRFFRWMQRASTACGSPAVVRESSGVTWRGGATPARSVPLARFYIAHEGKDSATTMNAALRAGKDLLLTPGTYDLAETAADHVEGLPWCWALGLQRCTR